ncbi:MAG: membrane protein insertase YidC, partial [Desulfobacterales bacterium]|nr:membrane protein insertase YidC [Desulfobacterales bacterium]
MEQMRLLLAIVLTVMVFLLWEVLVTPEKPVQAPQQQKQTETGKQPSGQREASETTQRTGAGSTGKKTEKPVEVPAKTFNSITVETDLYRAEITEKGAAIRQFVLKDYKSGSDSGSSLKTLVSGANPVGTALVRFSDRGLPDISNAVFTTDFEQSSLEVRKDARSISFFLETAQGVVLEKRYVFHSGSYGIDLIVSIVNQSDSAVPAGVSLDMTNPPPSGG